MNPSVARRLAPLLASVVLAAGADVTAASAIAGNPRLAPPRAVANQALPGTAAEREPPTPLRPAELLSLLLGFPAPAVPADNPLTVAKVDLGHRLFYDRQLSGDGDYACASCHRQELAFTDGRSRAVGTTGQLHRRSAPSLTNVAYEASLGWADPGLTRLEDQVKVPLLSTDPVELGVAGHEGEVVARLTADAGTRTAFAAAFPGEAEPVTLANVGRALASFERTLISGDSPFDRLLFRGEMDALSAAA